MNDPHNIQLKKARPVSSRCSGAEKPRRNRESGFSLLEILIVLAIMALIAALVAPRLFNQVDRSKQTVAETQVRAIVTALDTMRLDIGRYPTEQEGLNLLLDASSAAGGTRNWFGPYIEEIPLDPWGAAYRYNPPTKDSSGFDTAPFVFSLGADQEQGGAGLDADLGKVPANLSG